MKETLSIIQLYNGDGWLLLLYAAALIYLLRKRKNLALTLLMGVFPLVILAAFLFPLSFAIYQRMDGPETYYRLLWLLPVTATIAYAVSQLAEDAEKKSRTTDKEEESKTAGGRYLLVTLVCAIAIALGGRYTYHSVHIAPAENRLHLPQTVINLCDYIESQADGSRNIRTAFPSEHVHFVRQYTTHIRLPFGREMMVERWGFENPVYEEMEERETINAEKLADALLSDECRFVVLNAAKPMEGELEDYGYKKLVLLDGYYVYKNEDVPIK